MLYYPKTFSNLINKLKRKVIVFVMISLSQNVAGVWVVKGLSHIGEYIISNPKVIKLFSQIKTLLSTLIYSLDSIVEKFLFSLP